MASVTFRVTRSGLMTFRSDSCRQRNTETKRNENNSRPFLCGIAAFLLLPQRSVVTRRTFLLRFDPARVIKAHPEDEGKRRSSPPSRLRGILRRDNA